MTFGKQLKLYRKKLKYTQKEMASFLELVLITYQSYEQGKRKPMKLLQKMLLKKIKEKVEGKQD